MKHPVTTHHTRHGKPVRIPGTSKYVIVKADLHAPRGGTARTFHTRHGKPVRDPRTGKYVIVKPRSAHPYAHAAPVTALSVRTGKLKHGADRHGGRMPPVPARVAPSPPDRPATNARNVSTQSELYSWHKANGTLHVYYRMYGIDYDPDR